MRLQKAEESTVALEERVASQEAWSASQAAAVQGQLEGLEERQQKSVEAAVAQLRGELDAIAKE